VPASGTRAIAAASTVSARADRDGLGPQRHGLGDVGTGADPAGDDQTPDERGQSTHLVYQPLATTDRNRMGSSTSAWGP
jgi:hypothetical protein